MEPTTKTGMVKVAKNRKRNLSDYSPQKQEEIRQSRKRKAKYQEGVRRRIREAKMLKADSTSTAVPMTPVAEPDHVRADHAIQQPVTQTTIGESSRKRTREGDDDNDNDNDDDNDSADTCNCKKASNQSLDASSSLSPLSESSELSGVDNFSKEPHDPLAPVTSILPGPDVLHDSRAKRVTWGRRYITLLPWVSGPSGRNLLKGDAEHVEKLAKTVIDAEDCPFVFRVNYTSFPSPGVLAEYIQEKLAHGNVVVVRGYKNEENTPLTTQSIVNAFQVRENHPWLCTRAKNYAAPHVSTTLDKFITNTKQKKYIQSILDFPVRESRMPDFIDRIDQGYDTWYSFHDRLKDRVAIPIDSIKLRSWALLHQPTYHTFTHHDGEGLATWMRILEGNKFWITMRPSGYEQSTDRRAIFMHNAQYRLQDGPSNSWRFDYGSSSLRYSIYAEKGDIIIQPPNAWHEVYSPNESVVVGGHFYTYNSMHLTEISRYYDAIYPFTVTNNEHSSAQITLARMLLAIADDPNKVYYCKPIAALCRMILKPQDYLDKTENKYAGYLRALDDFRDTDERNTSEDIQESGTSLPNPNPDPSIMTYILQEDEKAAYRLAKYVQKKYKLVTTVSRVHENDAGVYIHLSDPDYLFESLPWMDPGPEIKFGTDLQMFRVV